MSSRRVLYITRSLARVEAFLASTNLSALEIAKRANVDDKTIRNARLLARKGQWNPRAETLARLESLTTDHAA